VTESVFRVAMAGIWMALPAGVWSQGEKASPGSQGRSSGQAAIRVHRMAAEGRSPDGRIHVRSIRFEPGPGQSARGTSCAIEMQNASKDTVTVFYTVRYFSNTGAALQYAVEDYIPFTFGPGEALKIDHTCPFHTAKRAVVEILEPARSK